MNNALKSISTVKNLREVWKEKKGQLCSSCFGVDRVSGATFKNDVVGRLAILSNRMQSGYRPTGLLAIAKPKNGGGNRIICVPSIADRLVQFSILNQLRPRLKQVGLDNPISFGLAPGRQRSVLGARKFACSARAERGWVYKTDIHKFFDNIDRDKLKKTIQSTVPQSSLHPLIGAFLRTEITDGIDPGWRKIVEDAGIVKGLGVRQGMPLSPFFAGAYLKQFDRWLLKRGIPAARYVDDIVVFFDNEKAARSFHPSMAAQMEKLGLSIGEIDDPASKTNLYSPTEPADFLGMEIRLCGTEYRLCVSDTTFGAVEDKFVKLSTIEGLSEHNVLLTTLGSYLSAVRCGYINAYDGAHNLKEFEAKLDQVSEGAKQTVLLELFGNRLHALTDAQRNFVGIT